MNGQHTSVVVRKDLERSNAYNTKDSSDDDRVLVAKAKSGHADAFGALYERHSLQIYRTAFRMLRNRHDAEDMVQRSFQRAFTSLVRFREDSSFSTWVTRIAINEVLMLLRQRRSQKEFSDQNNETLDARVPLTFSDHGPTPEQALARAELRRVVIQAISKLRRSLRTVVLLRDVHGFTSAEIAGLLNLTVGAVKARTFHARRHLRQHLTQKFKRGYTGLSIETHS